ncbi:hypothetical protein LTR36_002865 [Oleoguttula mirabilis]|uniref:Uncharacterized protein n=1 Tax=Oleoguttula mirabilis TaxID=1507867 RepID=A0AAV9JJT7_9PEZI|nr:hypothetical protein LTR36_002865 [Oleoguttula mirabilis]
MFSGIMRVSTLVVFGIGTFIYAPAVYMDDEAPTWLVPAAILGSAIPFAAAVAWGPQVTSIRAFLPANARRSKDALLAFANNTPPNTLLRLQFIRWAPWLVTRDMHFSDFRRLPKSVIRLSNLENVAARKVPEGHVEVLNKRYGWAVRAMRRYFDRYWVNVVTTGRDRSRVPGAWERMWRQIPMIGDEVVATVVKEERRPVTMQNRAQLGQQALPSRSTRAVKK